MKAVFDKITTGAGLFITIIVAAGSLHLHLLAKEKLSWENVAEHVEFRARISHIEDTTWTVSMMQTLYGSSELWTNHISDGQSSRFGIIKEIVSYDQEN